MPPNVPLLSTFIGYLLSIGFGILYVGALYVSKHTRLSFISSKSKDRNSRLQEREKLDEERWRDDPTVIKARLTAASIATLLSCTTVFFLLRNVVNASALFNSSKWTWGSSLSFAFQRLGLSSHGNVAPYLITPILYLGPLFSIWLGELFPFQRQWRYEKSIERYANWVAMRNFLVGPITEEVVFRSCVLAVYSLIGASKPVMIFCSPLVFGLAHAHHAWDTFNRYGRSKAAAKHAIFSSLFQFVYTTVFGFHCAYLFLRTSSIYPPITSHIICNIMGFPQLSWEVRTFPSHKRAIYVAYILGVVGYTYGMFAWAKSKDSIYW